MPDKHPLRWLIIYLILGLWNVGAAVNPGGPPPWLSIVVAGVMGVLALWCLWMFDAELKERDTYVGNSDDKGARD